MPWRPIVSLCLSVCLCVGHDRAPYKTAEQIEMPLKGADSRGPKKPCIRGECTSAPHGEYESSDAVSRYHNCSSLINNVCIMLSLSSMAWLGFLPPGGRSNAPTRPCWACTGREVNCYTMEQLMPKQVGNLNSKSLVAVGCFWLIQQTLSYSILCIFSQKCFGQLDVQRSSA